MHVLLMRIYHERRRLAVVAVLAYLAGFVMYARSPMMLHGLPVAYTTGAIYCLVVSVAAVLTCLLLPAIRFTIEMFALSRLIFAGFVAAFPAQGVAIAASPFLNATAVVGGGALLVLLFYGPWSGRLLRREHVTTLRFRSRHDAESLWQALLAGPRGAEAALGAARYSDAARGPGRSLHRLLSQTAFLAGACPQEARARGVARCAGAGAARELRVADLGAERAVEIRIRHRDVPLAAVIAAWLDDAYGRVYHRALTAPAAAPARPWRPALLRPAALRAPQAPAARQATAA